MVPNNHRIWQVLLVVIGAVVVGRMAYQLLLEFFPFAIFAVIILLIIRPFYRRRRFW